MTASSAAQAQGTNGHKRRSATSSISAVDEKTDRPTKRARSSHDEPGPPLEASGTRNAGTCASGLADQPEVTSSKTYSQDLLDYPRRRATIACEICRSRKSRCDGARPRCRLCSDLGANCIYREPGVKLDAGDKLILDQLARIEGMLHTSLIKPINSDPDPDGTISQANTNITLEDAPRKRCTIPLNNLGPWSANISTMPKTHTTPALHLLQWPVIRDLVSQQCDPQILMQLEMDREPLSFEQHYNVDFTHADLYIHAFFESVNKWYACVDPNTWRQYYQKANGQSFKAGAESCVVLLVFALGEAAHANVSVSRVPSHSAPCGMSFFAAAWNILPGLQLRNDVVAAQSYILAATYLKYLIRPLEAWDLLCSASMKLQLVLSSQRVPPHLNELSERIYWVTLLIESNLLAELDLPHTGIVQFEESMHLPRSFLRDTATPESGEGLPETDDIWYFLAEIALRRLLNRVSHLIYTHKGSASFSVASLEPIVAELDYQLTQWYENLPGPISFAREHMRTSTQIQTVLRLRYLACRTIIFRPYVLAVLHDEKRAHEPEVQEACHKCLEACIQQVECASVTDDGHLPYLWQGVLSMMSQTLLLMEATLSPPLRQLMLPAQQMDAIIAKSITQADRLAHLAPSLTLCASIMREAEDRRQTLVNGSRG